MLAKKLSRYFVAIFLLITLVGVFVPWMPGMPSAGLDTSWSLSLSQAVAQKLRFGQDIIFTFGPCASVYTKMYHPSTDFMMIVSSLFLIVASYFAIVLLFKDTPWYWLYGLMLVLAGMISSRDALLYMYPLLVTLVIFKLLNGVIAKEWLNQYLLWVVLVLFAPFGLLPLVKGTFLLICVAMTFMCMAFLAYHKKYFAAWLCVISSAISMCLFWLASGAVLIDLPNYFLAMKPIISGYGASMNNTGNSKEIILYIGVALCCFVVMIRSKKTNYLDKVFLCVVFFVFYFVSFKAGFLRHDSGHSITASGALLTAATLLPSVLKSRFLPWLMAFSVFSCGYIEGHGKSKIAIAKMFDHLKYTYIDSYRGLLHRLTEKDWPMSQFNASMEAIKKRSNFPCLAGTTDIYSYNQADLIASGNTWSPRPILQSYSVYTPELAQRNKEHLVGKDAPQHVIFSVEAIDNRMPSLEDGASWPVLFY